MTHDSMTTPVLPPPSPEGFSWKKFGLSVWEAVLVFMAIVLPAITFLVEAPLGFCAGVFFDPLPTPFHMVLVALVPAANLLVWLGLRRGWSARGRLLGLLNGAGLAISLLYSLVYLPLAPFAVLAMLVAWWYMGMGLLGLLPLSPLLALAGGLVLRRRLLRAFYPGERSLPGIRIGFSVALLLLLAASIPAVVTLAGLGKAISESPETRSAGISLLRRVNRNELILRASHGGLTMYDDVLVKWVNGGKRLDQAKARVIYYQVTGRDALHQKPRAEAGPMILSRRASREEFDWDNQQGGATVGGILKGLSLRSSRLDGILDGAAGTGYVEWTLLFRNEDDVRQREARATVALPPGAVVSRLTLWINGEEREAAFSSRGRVREAYEKVVRARRDPVLVTSCGPDRVLVQCFPVERGGGEMKVRLGITVPLQPAAGTSAVWTLNLPLFVERNFKLADESAHEVWLESRSLLKPGEGSPLTCEADRTGLWKARGRVMEAALWKTNEVLVIEGGGNGSAWCRDTRGETPATVRQTLVRSGGDIPASVVLVVDGSASMNEAAPRVAAALKESFPDGIRMGLIIAGDRKPERPEMRIMNRDTIRDLARSVETFDYTAGRCNVSALEEAWDTLSAQPGPGCLVWVHGAQPIFAQSIEGLRQRFERQPGMAALVGLQVKPGSDKISESFDMTDIVRSLPPCEDPARPLGVFFRGWGNDGPPVKALRTREERQPEAAEGVEASDHLTRLWAKREIDLLVSSRLPANRDKAVELASRYHLVTAVSGAVVLENEQQFKDANLQPVPSESLPIVPEPEWWILIAAVLAVVIWQGRRRLSVRA